MKTEVSLYFEIFRINWQWPVDVYEPEAVLEVLWCLSVNNTLSAYCRSGSKLILHPPTKLCALFWYLTSVINWTLFWLSRPLFPLCSPCQENGLTSSSKIHISKIFRNWHLASSRAERHFGWCTSGVSRTSSNGRWLFSNKDLQMLWLWFQSNSNSSGLQIIDFFGI